MTASLLNIVLGDEVNKLYRRVITLDYRNDEQLLF